MITDRGRAGVNIGTGWQKHDFLIPVNSTIVTGNSGLNIIYMRTQNSVFQYSSCAVPSSGCQVIFRSLPDNDMPA